MFAGYFQNLNNHIFCYAYASQRKIHISNHDIYTQTDGTPIGKSISGPLAGIFVAWL